MKIRFVSTAAVVICVLSFCLVGAEATLVPIAITAEVTEVADTDGLLEDRINLGDLMTGVYIYDLSTPDLDPWERAGRYEYYAPPAGITLTVGGLVFMTDPDNVDFTVGIANDQPPAAGHNTPDAYSLVSAINLPLPNAVLIREILLVLGDFSGSALSSDALPTTSPIIDDWDTDIRYVVISGRAWEKGRAEWQSFQIRGDLTSAVLIPEPATFVLLSLGGLALLKKRRPTRGIASRSGHLYSREQGCGAREDGLFKKVRPSNG